MSEAMLPPKKDVAMALLKGPSVYVHLDPRQDSVIVPKWFKKQPQLVLQIGMNMAVPILDLDVGEDGISCTLSFNRSPFWCSMPWSAIYALVGEDGRGMIWPTDVPGELAAKTPKPALKVVGSKKAKKRAAKPEARKKIERARPKLSAVESVPAEAASSVHEAEDNGKSKLPPYLRVIK
jgi:stringent starvation protein B